MIQNSTIRIESTSSDTRISTLLLNTRFIYKEKVSEKVQLLPLIIMNDFTLTYLIYEKSAQFKNFQEFHVLCSFTHLIKYTKEHYLINYYLLVTLEQSASVWHSWSQFPALLGVRFGQTPGLFTKTHYTYIWTGC